MKQRILNLLISTDQFVFSVITLGKSNPDETISPWAWRAEQSGKVQGRIIRPLIDLLFWFDSSHCQTSYMSELNQTQLPNEYRNIKGKL